MVEQFSSMILRLLCSFRHYPAIKWRHQHSSNQPKADRGSCHRRNKWGKSLSQAVFLSPLTRLHDCAGTFMDCLIRCGQIKTKSSQTSLNLVCDQTGCAPWTQKTNILLTIKHCFILFSCSDSIYFPQHFFFRTTFFLLVKMGFVLMSWAQYWFPIIPGVDIFWSIILQSQHIPPAAVKWIYGQPDLGNMEIMKYP